MSAIRAIVISCVACFLANATLAADGITQDKAVAIASGYLRSPKVEIASFEISAERHTTPPRDAVIPVKRFGSHPFCAGYVYPAEEAVRWCLHGIRCGRHRRDSAALACTNDALREITTYT